VIGRTVGHYSIISLLGKGGMGEVYRARDLRLERDVALKVLPPELAGDPDRLARFEREARTLAGLNHPHVVHVYSVEEGDGIRFFTMELVEGRGLDTLLAAGGLPRDEVLKIGIAVADALAAAHDKGVVHRDLKPANVMITGEGRVKVLDFGLAKPPARPAAEDDVTQALLTTQAGSLLGTVPYMSPEQLRGGDVDHRSDIFALGVLLYEMAAGRRPFEGPSRADVTSAILREAPVPITDVNPGLPSDLERIVTRCLEKNPDDRYHAAADIRNELRSLRRDMEPASRMSGKGRASPGASRRFPLRAALLGGAMLVLAVAAVAYLRVRGGEDAVKTLAVLPFENLSPDPENEFFTTGVHEDVMNTLGGLGGLRVISRTSVRRVAAGDNDDLPAIARRLGARYIVEGSVQREGNEVRVTARLIDASRDQQLWSDSYTRELRDILALQSEIALQIAGALRAKLSPRDRDHLGEKRTVVVAAYDDYIKARNILNSSRVGYDDLQEAIGRLRAATLADPGFADGWAWLGRALSDDVDQLRQFDGREADAAAAEIEARTALDRAVDLAPDSPTVLTARGYFQETVEHDPVNALRSMDRALAVSPNDSETLFFEAQMYFHMGQLDPAIANLEKAYALDSGNGAFTFGLTVFYEMAGRYADMVPFLEHLLELEPEKTHYAVQARYYRFLADGSLESYRAFEDAVRSVRQTPQCNMRAVQNRDMVVAMFNDDFEAYATDWKGRWDQHYAGHGNWACPMVINDEANQARLLLERHHTREAEEIIAKAKVSTMRPYNENSVCIFDRASFFPKLAYMSGDTTEARREFEESVPSILANDVFPRGAIERSVLLETADLVAPDRVYPLYKEISGGPASLVRMETICANPWTFPHLIRDPRFVSEVLADGRFTDFLRHYEILGAQAE